ncbi:MAG: hypothetical protein HON23_06460 [Rickettsiales bacterium]|jgi:hypothetical protein|nr:hypothetical protein [Rickettsiales bacterium]
MRDQERGYQIYLAAEAESLLAKFIEEEGLFAPFTLDNFPIGYPNISAQLDAVGLMDTLRIRAVQRGRFDLVQILIDQLGLDLSQAIDGVSASQDSDGEWLLEYREPGTSVAKKIPVTQAILEQLKAFKLCLEPPREVAVLADGGEASAEAENLPAAKAEGLVDGAGFVDEEEQRRAEGHSKECCSIM